MFKEKLSYIIISLILTILSAFAFAKTPPLQHGRAFHGKPININQFFISEKLDGVRGYWDGKNLYTRQGNKIEIPQTFTAHWPTTPLDGELWNKRHNFEQISGCIRRQTADECWREINFYIFDMPAHKAAFITRVKQMRKICSDYENSRIRCIKQFKLNSTEQLYKTLDEVIALKGEGLMLHHQDALYQATRVSHLLKLKPSYEGIAKVIDHIPGKGKYRDMLGAIRVKNKEGIIFKIGTGFSDNERRTPPKVGKNIRYKYLGKTVNDVPRFASFIRIIEEG